MLDETLTKTGKYEMVEEAGRGSVGVVYAANDPFSHRMVAITSAVELVRQNVVLRGPRLSLGILLTSPCRNTLSHMKKMDLETQYLGAALDDFTLLLQFLYPTFVQAVTVTEPDIKITLAGLRDGATATH